jgi:outer membrane protein assembly factor BamB
MFHHDQYHTGLAAGTGNIDPATGPVIRWSQAVVPPPVPLTIRWASSFPLGDLDGDGTLEVVVTSPEGAESLSPRLVVLKDTPGQDPPVRELWSFVLPQRPGETGGVDQYSAALADADGDGLLDVIFSARDGFVRAVKGSTGELIWQYQTNRVMEAGPMVGDLDGDGSLEVIQLTDCPIGDCPPPPGSGMLLVFAADPSSDGTENPPLWTVDLGAKSDSGEPAIADLDPSDGQDRQALIFGSWGGKLTVMWRTPSGEVVRRDLELRTLDPSTPHDLTPVVRTSPLVVDVEGRPTVIFGWMPNWQDYLTAHLSAVGLTADMAAGTVDFEPLWTTNDDIWKSSPAWAPSAGPVVLGGTGIGESPSGGFACEVVQGGVVARDLQGNLAWSVESFGPGRGDLRGAAAVADIDGDGALEAVIGLGCGGSLYAFDAATGTQEWSIDLGPKTFSSPSIGDLDGDGTLEIVVASYDGNVYALGGRP